MDDHFSVYIHFNGMVATSKGVRQYVGGKVQRYMNIDPDRFSKPEMEGILREIGVFDFDCLYYAVSVVNFECGLRELKNDKDALDIVQFASLGHDVHVYVSHVGYTSLEPPDACVKERTMEETENSGEEEKNMGIHDDDEDLPYMHDPDYEDPRGENLYSILVEGEYGINEREKDGSVGDISGYSTWSKKNEPKKRDGLDSFFGLPVEGLSDSDSEYQNSDFIVTPTNSDEEGDLSHPRWEEFRQHTDMSDPKFKLGMLFKDHHQFKEAIINYKIKWGYRLRNSKNESGRVRYKCVNGCPWEIFASLNKEIGCLQVKTLVDEHNCSKSHNSRQVNSKWVARKIMDKVRRNPHYKLSEIIEDMKADYEVKICISKAQRARKFARIMVEGNYEDQFRRVRDYGYEILRSNPGSTVKIDLASPVLYFKRMYICLAACKQGFLNHCRPVISVDGCHLRGPISGQILTAVGIDANDGMYPIAVAVVEAETKESWKWFFNNLYGDIGSVQEHGWVFYSDQQKGLVPALSEVFTGARNRFCLRHLYANFKKSHRGLVLKEMMEAAARETTLQGFEKRMEEIRKVDTEAEQYLRLIPTEHWCKYTFSPYPKCDMLLNNLAETFNSKILEARDKPVVTMIETIRRYLMCRIQRNRDAMLKFNGPICPRIQAKLEKSKSEAMRWTVTWNGGHSYEVVRGREQYIVDLHNRTCACYKWDITGIPCEHAVGAIAKTSGRSEDYVDNFLTKDTYLNTYSYLVQPLNGEELWPKAGGLPILPPRVRKQPGRPRRHKRKRDKDEVPTSGKLKKTGGKSVCSACKTTGHNKRTCKGGMPVNNEKKQKQTKDKGRSFSSATNGEGGGEKEKGKSTPSVNLGASNGTTKNVVGPSHGSKNKGKEKMVTCMGFRVPSDKTITKKKTARLQSSQASSTMVNQTPPESQASFNPTAATTVQSFGGFKNKDDGGWSMF